MASSYFTLPSFARAKKNKEELEKQNPQQPLLNDEDEKFLEKQISHDEAGSEAEDAESTMIFDNGKEKKASKDDQAAVGDDQIAVPVTQPATVDGPDDTKDDAAVENAVGSLEVAPDASTTTSQAKKSKKNKDFELPSQEVAEAATRGFGVGTADFPDKTSQQSGEKRSWASYIPASMTSSISSLAATKDKPKTTTDDKISSKSADTSDRRSWAQYASAYVPSLPTLLSKDKDATVEPVLNEDGTINAEATKEKQEREVSVLLDNLNLSSINNRVFAFSGETQKIYDRFALVLHDTMNGGPTAYEDMEKLMKEAGPQLEKQFKSMPPFVQTLVKSLPAKLGATLAPELLAATSEKPGADLKARQAGVASASSSSTGTSGKAQKKKRRIPTLKSLIGKQGAVATILRNVVNFLRVRFPLLASGTNVLMSLAVFILMFVFWYCHKRGKETRLAREAEAEAGKEGEEDSGDLEVSDDDDDNTNTAEDAEKSKAEVLNQPSPSEIPLPAEAGEKKATSW